jgi:hypothetical protein
MADPIAVTVTWTVTVELLAEEAQAIRAVLYARTVRVDRVIVEHDLLGVQADRAARSKP